MLGRLSARAAHTLQLRLSALYGLSAGARIWDSGREMAALLQQQGESLRGKRVLELGAGTGIGGLSAAACGADVLLSDQDMTDSCEPPDKVTRFTTENPGKWLD